MKRTEWYVVIDYEARESTQFSSRRDAELAITELQKSGPDAVPKIDVVHGELVSFSMHIDDTSAPAPKKTRKPRTPKNTATVTQTATGSVVKLKADGTPKRKPGRKPRHDLLDVRAPKGSNGETTTEA